MRRWATAIHAAVPEAVVVIPTSAEAAAVELADAQAAIGTLPPELLLSAEALQWLQAPLAAPPAGYFYPALVDHPVVVTNLRAVYTEHVAIHAVALLLALARGLPRFFDLQRQHLWVQDRNAASVVYLPEATVLIVGLGGVGLEIARLCKAFGMRVLGTDARRSGPIADVDEVHVPGDLDDLLPEADFVVLGVPHTPETEGLMNRTRLQRMRRSGFLINIGRGVTLRLDDLVSALDAGEIAGAALDVFEEEPLPAAHPLWSMPNVVITPHVAVTGPYTDDRREEIVVENAARFARNEPLINVVDKSQWL
jgi:phosphoglycerate dehydrogenase-like enzyme